MSDDKLFRSLGLKESTLKNINNNQNIAKSLKSCIEEANIINGCDGSVGKLIFDVATSKKMMNETAQKHRKLLLQYIVKQKIKNTIQLSAAYDYISKNEKIDSKQFETSCGVGVEVTEKEINQTVDNVINKYKDQLSTKGYDDMKLFIIFFKKFLKFFKNKNFNYK